MIGLDKIQEWDRLIANMPADGSAMGHLFVPYRQAMTEMLSAIVTLSNALIDASQKRCKCGDGDTDCDKNDGDGCCGGGEHKQCSHGCGD